MTDPKQELQTELTLSDLTVIVNVIDYAASKGIFKTIDYPAIGSVYSKLVSVLGKVKNEV